MDWTVPLADLDYGPPEEAAVLDVLRSHRLAMGEVTQEFEKEFAGFVGTRHALAVSNATEALHLACLALGIGPGDEVIVPSLTFVASVNAVHYTGARVRFAEILGPQDLNISPEAVEREITSKTRAVIVMHYGGYPCQMETILQIAARHGLAVIEDAAHAPGAALNGKPLGTWGDIGCFSFFSNMNLSTGEGGILVTDRVDVAEKVRLLRSHGMTSLSWDYPIEHAATYDVVDLGYNYRIDELRSALGLAQLKKLVSNNARRKVITERYWRALEGKGLELPFRYRLGAPAFHIFPILLAPGVDRRQFFEMMRAAKVQTGIHYPPVHKFRYYQDQYPTVSMPITESVAAREVTLPLYPTMDDTSIELVIESVLMALESGN
jgi:dTDP-4-amino-4,6-dideoxygalactose transaminase